MKKILLKGFFGHNNLGDDLLLLEGLKKYPKDVMLYIEWPRGATKELKYYQSVRDFVPIYGIKEILRHRYDAVVWSGGGLFPSRIFGFKQLLKNSIYRFVSSKMILNGVGIVPKPKRHFFDYFLRLLDYCSVRDDKSWQFVSGSAAAINCGDLYWGSETSESNGGGNRTRKQKYLVCLANPFSDVELKNVKTANRFEKLVKQCGDLIRTYRNTGYEINYLPFYRGSDEKFIDRVQQYVGTNDKVLHFGEDFDLDTINHLFQQYSFGLCMRFHSILLAVKNSLPIVAIEYDFKSEMLLKEAGLEEMGIRYGIRKGEFFGEETDIEDGTLLKLDERMQRDRDNFIKKSLSFSKKKKIEVLANYQNIFRIIGI